jgi:hypothetical protein
MRMSINTAKPGKLRPILAQPEPQTNQQEDFFNNNESLEAVRGLVRRELGRSSMCKVNKLDTRPLNGRQLVYHRVDYNLTSRNHAEVMQMGLNPGHDSHQKGVYQGD